MAGPNIAYFQNDAGVAEIKIGAKEFMCSGASEPHDHPHVFLDMGEDVQIVCPYCSTLFSYDVTLHDRETIPKGCARAGN